MKIQLYFLCVISGLSLAALYITGHYTISFLLSYFTVLLLYMFMSLGLVSLSLVLSKRNLNKKSPGKHCDIAKVCNHVLYYDAIMTTNTHIMPVLLYNYCNLPF